MKKGEAKVVSLEEVGNERKIASKRMVAYDENGEIVYDVIKRPHWQNGGGFVLSYTEKMCEFLETVSAGATVRVFLYLAHHQGYGQDSVFGYRCSHKFLQQVLKLDRKSIYNALCYLKENFLVHEGRFDGVAEFMVNPNYVTIGTDKKRRLAEWNARWAAYWKEKNSKLVVKE